MRSHIPKRDGEVILIDYFCGDLSSYNFTENTIIHEIGSHSLDFLPEPVRDTRCACK